MKRFGTWLGVAAIALQVALPLLAGALPRSVALVPLCTVDGIAHYVEVPTGKSPVDDSSGHAGHCPLCCLGHAAAPLGDTPLRAGRNGVQDRPARAFQPFAPWGVILRREARAPPPDLTAD